LKNVNIESVDQLIQYLLISITGKARRLLIMVSTMSLLLIRRLYFDPF